MKRLAVVIILLLIPHLILAFDDNKLQQQIDELASKGGGVIRLENRTYYIAKTLILHGNVSLVGENSGSAFWEISSNKGTCLKWVGGRGTVIFIQGPWTGRIENLTIDGGYIADIGIHADSIQGGIFRNLNIAHTNIRALFVTTSTTTSALNLFERVFIHDNALIGLDMEGSLDLPVTLNTFIMCRFKANYISLRIERWTDTNLWIGCRVEVPYDDGIGIAFERHEQIYNNCFLFTAIEGYGVGIICLPSDCNKAKPNVFWGTTFGGNLRKDVYTEGEALIEFD